MVATARHSSPPPGLTVLVGQWIDGTGAEPKRGAALTVAGGHITRIAGADDVPRGADVLDLREYTVLPGLINAHVHTMLPGDGTPFLEWMALPDEVLLLQAYANARDSLAAGVTTLRDCGGKGQLMFRLRDAIRRGVVEGPRLVLGGRPLTITGGHCRPFGGEVDGAEGMRYAARQMLAEGADFVKIMASGGGTPGTYSQFPSFDLDELRAAIHEAHKIGKLASCHCIASSSIALALDAGADVIEHAMFMAPDTTWQYDEALAQRIADAGVIVCPTLQTGADSMKMMRERVAAGIATPDEAHIIAVTPNRTEDNLSNSRFLHELGIPLIAGSDAGWRYTGFDDFWEELALLARAGLTPLEAIHAATGLAATACQLDGVVGTLVEGCAADLIAVAHSPLDDLAHLARPAVVLHDGAITADRR